MQSPIILQKISLNKAILMVIGIIIITMGVMIFIHPPSIFPDASHGFQVMRSMQMGGKFNMLTAPDQDDISQNSSAFISWWSPGQYLVPYFFQSILKVNTGQASAITIIIFELSGLAGLYCFFRKIGFNSLISAVSLLFIACQVAFIIPFVFYNGGEILLFGFVGWFLYGCLAVDKPGIKLLAFVLLSGWLGFICKSSFMWLYSAGLLCLWLRLSATNTKVNMRRLVINGIWIGIPAILSLVTIYVFYLSKGATPASAPTGLKLTWQTFSFPLASPLLSGFSVDDLFNGLVFHTTGQVYNPCFIIAVLLLLAALSLILIAGIIQYVPNNNYRLFLLVFYTVSLLFFCGAYLRQLNISYEARHYRIIGLLIVPGTIYLFSTFKPIYQLFFGVACVGIAISSYAFFIKGYKFNVNVSARGNTGIAQEYIDQPSLNYLMQLDRQNSNAIFAFITPDIGLEISHNRVITIDPPTLGEQIDYEDFIYDGHAGPLYLLLPANYNNVATLLKFFPGYSSFTTTQLGRKYILYAAK